MVYFRVCCCSAFKRYHVDHHKYQGEDNLDGDLPSTFEVKVVGHNMLLKLVWVVLQPLAYALRPSIMLPKKPTRWEAINYTVVLLWDYVVFSLLGWKGLLYMVCGTLLGESLFRSLSRCLRLGLPPPRPLQCVNGNTCQMRHRLAVSCVCLWGRVD